MSTRSWSTYREALAAIDALPDRRRQATSVADHELAARLAAAHERVDRRQREIELIFIRLRERREQLAALSEQLGVSSDASGSVEPLAIELPLVAVENELEQLAQWAAATAATVASLERTLTRESARTPTPVVQPAPVALTSPPPEVQRRTAPFIIIAAAAAVVGVLALIIILILFVT